MNDLSATIAAARRGEIIHFQGNHPLRPIAELLCDVVQGHLGANTKRENLLADLTWPTFESALAATAETLDASKSHLERMSELLLAAGVRGENLLHITLAKSWRASLADRGRRNSGYPPHRDSWFSLAPDGVNIVLYLTSVPYYGNTPFYLDYFGKEVPYDSATRTPLPPCDLARVTAFSCAPGDCLVFAGDQLHGGASVEVDRLSVEFRISRGLGFGRPEQGIVYQPVV